MHHERLAKKRKAGHDVSGRPDPAIVTWIQDRYEAKSGSTITRSSVYTSYVAFCKSQNISPLASANFGKLFHSVFPDVTSRRLGVRGQSRYHYCGIGLRASELDSGNNVESDDDSFAVTTPSTTTTAALTTPRGEDPMSWDTSSLDITSQHDTEVNTSNGSVPLSIPAFTAPFSQSIEDSTVLSAITQLVKLYHKHCCHLLHLVTTGCVTEVGDYMASVWASWPESVQRLFREEGNDGLVNDAVWRWDSALYDTILSVHLPTLDASVTAETTRDLMTYADNVAGYVANLWKEECLSLRDKACQVAEIFACKCRRLVSLNDAARSASDVLGNEHTMTTMAVDLQGIQLPEVFRQALWLDKVTQNKAIHAAEEKALSMVTERCDLAEWMTWTDQLVESHFSQQTTPLPLPFVHTWSHCIAYFLRHHTVQRLPSHAALRSLCLFLDDYAAYSAEERMLALNIASSRLQDAKGSQDSLDSFTSMFRRL